MSMTTKAEVVNINCFCVEHLVMVALWSRGY